jgi:hypothetical protein
LRFDLSARLAIIHINASHDRQKGEQRYEIAVPADDPIENARALRIG